MNIEVDLLKQKVEFLQYELEDAKSRENQLKQLYDKVIYNFQDRQINNDNEKVIQDLKDTHQKDLKAQQNKNDLLERKNLLLAQKKKQIKDQYEKQLLDVKDDNFNLIKQKNTLISTLQQKQIRKKQKYLKKSQFLQEELEKQEKQNKDLKMLYEKDLLDMNQRAQQVIAELKECFEQDKQANLSTIEKQRTEIAQLRQRQQKEFQIDQKLKQLIGINQENNLVLIEDKIYANLQKIEESGKENDIKEQLQQIREQLYVLYQQNKRLRIFAIKSQREIDRQSSTMRIQTGNLAQAQLIEQLALKNTEIATLKKQIGDLKLEINTKYYKKPPNQFPSQRQNSLQSKIDVPFVIFDTENLETQCDMNTSCGISLSKSATSFQYDKLKCEYDEMISKLKDAKVQLAVVQEGYSEQVLAQRLELKKCQDILKQIALKQRLDSNTKLYIRKLLDKAWSLELFKMDVQRVGSQIFSQPAITQFVSEMERRVKWLQNESIKSTESYTHTKQSLDEIEQDKQSSTDQMQQNMLDQINQLNERFSAKLAKQRKNIQEVKDYNSFCHQEFIVQQKDRSMLESRVINLEHRVGISLTLPYVEDTTHLHM